MTPYEVTLEDTIWFYFTEPDSLDFLKLAVANEVEETKLIYTNPRLTIDTPLSIKISLSSQKVQYRRKVLTFFEVTGFLGGIFEIFEVTFGSIIGIISFYSFKRNIIKQIKEAKGQDEGIKKEYLQRSERSQIANSEVEKNPSIILKQVAAFSSYLF